MPHRHHHRHSLHPGFIDVRRASFVTRLIVALAVQASPTRTCEYLLTWFMIGWGGMVALPGEILVGPLFSGLTAIMPEPWWAALALITGVTGLGALIVNGSSKRTPTLRLICACVRMGIWMALARLFFNAVYSGGAPLIPTMGWFPALIYLEFFCAWRCGQDRIKQRQAVTAEPWPQVHLPTTG